MNDGTGDGWLETDTHTFLDLARYAVPGRERQIEAMLSLIPATEEPFDVLEVCCGEGLLSEAILERFPQAWVTAFDGSMSMLRRAKARCARFGVRFEAKRFDLADRSWRQARRAPHAIVSSLALHHLDGGGKQVLFHDVQGLLTNGGALIVADIVEPASEAARAYAADAWDAAVKARSRHLDGGDRGFETFEREKWNLFRHPDPDVDKPSTLFDQLSWLEAAGFRGVDVFWMAAGHAIFGGFKT